MIEMGVLTWTNAVATRTPVPKCLQAKKTLDGTLSHLTFFAKTGKPAPKMENINTRTSDNWSAPVILETDIINSLYSHFVQLTQPQDVNADIVFANELTATALRFAFLYRTSLGSPLGHAARDRIHQVLAPIEQKRKRKKETTIVGRIEKGSRPAAEKGKGERGGTSADSNPQRYWWKGAERGEGERGKREKCEKVKRV